MATTVTVGDGTTEVFEPKAKTPLKAVPKPEIEPPKVDDSETTDAVEAVEDEADDTDADDSDGELSERAKKIIAKQKRAIDKKHRAMREADELAREQFDGRKAAEQRAEDLAKEVAALKSQTAAANEKTRADFKDDEEWINHLADRRMEAREIARKQEELKAEKDQIEAGRIARNEAFAKTVPDWEETMERLASKAFAVSPAIEQFFYESDASAQVLYYLGNHPDEYAAIVKLKPTRQIKALGDLENSLIKPAVKDKSLSDAKPISKAPAPTTSIIEGTTPVEKDPQKMSTDEYLAFAARRRREKAQMGRR